MAGAAYFAISVFSMGISLAALRFGQQETSSHFTFGWNRAESLGTVVSVTTTWIVNLWVIYEAIKRFFEPNQVYEGWMLVFSVVTLLCQIINVRILASKTEQIELSDPNESRELVSNLRKGDNPY